MPKMTRIGYHRRINRREFNKLLSLSGLSLLSSSTVLGFGLEDSDQYLPAWEQGFLDIHHINTGRGDSTFFVFPDGTTLLFDAGALDRERPENYDSDIVPDSSKRPGEWITRYIKHFYPLGDKTQIDYAMISHFHGDHYGTVTDQSLKSKRGNYRLAGITDVGDAIPIRTLLDRGWPDYDWPNHLKGDINLDNYREFIRWQSENNNMAVQQFIPGRIDQITLRFNPNKYSDFRIRNIAANGYVWTGNSTEVRNRFPKDDPPNENNCSIAFRLNYGDFTYYTGGDLGGAISDSSPAWRDMESALAWVVGPVDVHIPSHHALNTNSFFISVLKPRVHIISNYASSQPSPAVMERLLSNKIYSGARDIFLLNKIWKGRRVNMIDLYGEEKTAYLEKAIGSATSSQGHVVVRVYPTGKKYDIFVLYEDSLLVKSKFPNFQSRENVDF